MPKSFLVKKPSRNKRRSRLEEERYEGEYLYCYNTNTPDVTTKGQCALQAEKQQNFTWIIIKLSFILSQCKFLLTSIIVDFLKIVLRFCYGVSPRFAGSAQPAGNRN